MAVALGATIIGSRLLAAEFGNVPGIPAGFNAADIALLDELGDTIIPTTDVPGAKATGIGEFIVMMVADCLTPPEQERFKAGLAGLDPEFRERFGGTFVSANPADRLKFLNERYRGVRRGDGKRAGKADADSESEGREGGVYFFRTLKQLTILGYFTSEIGCTQALHYEEVPGRFDGCADYHPGDHNWFTEMK